MSNYIRILRVVEYRGPRAAVEDQVERSLHGTKRLPTGVIISAATVGQYPEMIDNPIPDETPFGLLPGQPIGRPTKGAVLAMAVGDLNLSVRAWNCFNSVGIKTVADLVKYTPEKLRLIKHLGKTTLRQIQIELSGYGLELAKK